MQDYDSNYYQQIFEPIENNKFLDLETDRVSVKLSHESKHECGHHHQALKTKTKSKQSKHKLINMEYSGISGIKRLKSKHQKTKEHDEKEI